ncbi:hypothetical protein QUV96_04305 [Amedibacillus dolichus]|uniref:Uncharacterized protein n=1 Tax=Amedibacillus dolichus TaxID=31971 RepID=A0ABT7UB61_9FIRM|nr:hypothetical protein [Amedibacillus dolichus]MDM8156857.1 hypothetical protein [Amedibacillus dolichus]
MDVWMIVLVTLIVVAVIFGGNVLLRRHYTKKIVIAMSQEDYDGFFKVLDSSGSKLILRPSEREMMRLSAYLTLGKAKDIEEQLQLMLHMRLKKKERAAVATRGFYYYVEAKNRRKANDMIKIVEENGAPGSAKELKMIASVLLRKEAKYIKEFQSYYDNAKADEQRGMFAYLLGLQYSYIDDEKNTSRYLKEAQQLLKGTPYEEVIRDLLKERKKNR